MEILKRIALKLTSIKTLLLVWSCFTISFIVFKNRVDFNNVAMLLVAVPLTYFPVNLLQKRGEEK